jgi:putative membrane protein
MVLLTIFDERESSWVPYKKSEYSISSAGHQSELEVAMIRRRVHKSPVKGAILGSLSGLAGTVLMTQFLTLWKKAAEETSLRKKNSSESKKSEEEKEDSTMKTAEKLGKAAGYKPSKDERKKAGNWIHYGFGAAMGTVYGLLKETAPRSLRRMNPGLSGAGYGSLVFLGAHEIAVPALKLGSNPLKESAADQLSEYLAHIVYGLGTSLTYSAVRRLG